MKDYLENGNIRNSVNYPNCDMGDCISVCRVGINHRNTKNMISQFTSIFGNADMNICNMVNKSKGDYAYSLFDLEQPLSAEVLERLKSVDGVLRVRVIK